MPPDYIKLIIVAEMTERKEKEWKRIAFSFEDITHSVDFDVFKRSVELAEKDLVNTFPEFKDYNYIVRCIQEPESFNYYFQYGIFKNNSEQYACDWLNYVITPDSVNPISKGKIVFQPE
jgi:hypothetical protein